MQFVSINRDFEESILRLFRDLMEQRNIFIASHEVRRPKRENPLVQPLP